MGITKNAVVSKAHRLGLPSRPSPIKRTGEHRRRKSRLARDRVTLPKLAALMEEASSPAALDEESTPVTGGNGTSQIVRRRTPSAPSRVVMLRPTQISTSPCQWPYGEPRTKSFRFCGAPETVIGKPYCPDHCCVAYMRVPDRQGDAA
jgi:GcrA cell cycle regulator